MSEEQVKPTTCFQSGTSIWRLCAVLLGSIFVSGIIGGAIGGAIGAAVYGPHPADWGYAAAFGFAAGVYLVSVIFERRSRTDTSKTESDPKCYKRSFLIFTPLGGILLLLGIINLGSKSEALRILAWVFLWGAIDFVMTGLAHGMRYWRSSR